MAIGLAIGAAIGLAKNFLVDQPRAQKQRELAAATQKYSPWTGLKADPVQEADPFGTALQFAGTGAALDSNMKTSAATQNYLNSGGTPHVNFNSGWGGFGGGNGGYNFTGASMMPSSYQSQYYGTLGR